MNGIFKNGGVLIKKILIVEDDRTLSNGITLALQDEHTKLVQCFTIASARVQCLSDSYDLIILDIHLPDGNGLDFLCEIKQKINTPVIFLTANDLEMDIVSGLELGASDYVTKPFSLAILRARVKAQLRKQITTQSQYHQDAFMFDFERMEFMKHGRAMELSKTEQKLLRILVENKGMTLKRGILVERVWKESEYVDENALSVSIKRLRDKLEDDPAKPHYIKTIYGLGYSWVVK